MNWLFAQWRLKEAWTDQIPERYRVNIVSNHIRNKKLKRNTKLIISTNILLVFLLIFLLLSSRTKPQEYLYVFALYLVLVRPVEVKPLRIHVQSHRSHSRQILKRDRDGWGVGGSGEVTNHGDGFTCCSHFRRRELHNAAPACAEDSHLPVICILFYEPIRGSSVSREAGRLLTRTLVL